MSADAVPTEGHDYAGSEIPNAIAWGDEPQEVAAPAAPAPAPPAPAPAPQPETYSHPRWLERAAIEQGMEDDAILTTPTDALTQKVYAAQQRKIADAHQQTVDREIRQAVKNAPPVEVPHVQEEDFSITDEEAAGLEPWFVKKFNAMVAASKAKDDKIAKLEGLGQQFQQAQVQTFEQQFTGLCATRPDIFGEGPIQPNSPQARKAQAVLQQLQTLQQRTTLANDWNTIVNDIFGSKQAAPPAPKVDQDREAIKSAYRNGGLSKPTQREETPLAPGRKLAEINLKKRFLAAQANGVNDDVYGDDPRDSMLGGN
jgi:hypothetical protein